MTPDDQDREERLRQARERAAAFRRQTEAARASRLAQQPQREREQPAEQGELSREERLRLARERAQAARGGGQAAAAPAAPAQPAAAQPAATAPERPRRPRAAGGAAPPPARAERLQDIPIVPPEPGTVYDIFKEVLPDVEFVASQGPIDVNLSVKREDVGHVLTVAREHPRLAFDYLRCLSGLDQMERGLEVVYQLYSFTHRHNVVIRTIVPTDDPHVPTATHLWKAADWHERETWEMFGIVFDGHPNLVPLLLPEEGLDYFPLRRDHPLAEIEEPQSKYLGEEFEEEE